MAIQGFNKSFYLNAKLAQLQANSETAADWAGKDVAFLEARLQNGFGLTAEQHYEQYGFQEGLAPNAFFNPAEYIRAKATAMFNDANNSYLTIDAAAQDFVNLWGGNVYNHYLQYGEAEGVNPSNSFDVSGYYEAKLAQLQAAGNTEITTVEQVKASLDAAGLTALEHFIAYGQDEGITAPAVPEGERVNVDTSVVGQTFSLTASVDTLTGTKDDDTFNANVVANPATGVADVETLTSLDTIDGGAGNDTLNYTTVGGTALPAATISNVETINVVSDGAATADVSGSNITGITTLNAKATNGAVDLDTKSNVTSINVTGTATTVDIDDAGTGTAATADKLASVSVTGNTGVLTVDSDALTTLSLANTNQNATVSAAAATRALTVNVNAVTGGTIADAEATSLTVNAEGKESSGVTLNAAKATGVTINADEKLTVADVNIAAAKNLTVTGDSATTISATSTVTALESVNASASTGGLTITPTLGTGVAFTGGAGKDSVSLGATTKAIAMGAGDDTVNVTAALGTGGSIDAGEGTDTLSMTSAVAETLSATDTFEKSISNFEKVQIGSVAEDQTDTVNLANLDDISYLISAGTDAVGGGTTAGVLAVTNMASGGTFELTGVLNGNASVSVKDAATGTADSLNIKLNNTANTTNVGNLTVASVETINIEATDSSVDTTTLTNPAAASKPNLIAADATKIVVSGNHGVDFTGSTLTKVTELDASGVVATGATTGATAAQIGTAGAVTFSSAVTDKAVTVTTGNGADVISTASITDATFIASGVTASTISTGAGDDTITGSAGKDVINAGEGRDTVNSSAEADTITLGAGNDIYVLSSASHTTVSKSDVITDFNANTFGQGTNGAANSAGANTTVANLTGDTINVSAVYDSVNNTGISVFVASNASDAQTFLQNTGNAGSLTGFALDSSTGKLYMDFDSNGTVDSVLTLQGVTTIDEAAFVIA